LEPALESSAGLIDLLEIEPQGFWRRASDGTSLIADVASLQAVQSIPLPKLVHGIGFPVGGTRAPLAAEIDLLAQTALQLNAPWLSEHLSFNKVNGPSGAQHTSFLLPPRQTVAGVEAAVRSVRAMSARMPVPMAFETGVNYLRPRPDELPDGEFIGRVAERADCGILLDLHNIWANERNGRQSVADYLDQIPLDRVWEVHLAGGSDLRGYWLDAHSGAVPAELMELAAQVLPRLPNLKALIFELFPAYLPTVGIELFRSQLEDLHRLWDRRRPLPAGPSPEEWEDALGSLAIGSAPCTPLATELNSDPGIAIIREVVGQFRASMVARTLRLSSRLIMMERGSAFLESLLSEYWSEHPPQPFAFDEAEGFAAFLRCRRLDVPFLDEVLEYDRAVMATALDGNERLIPFRADPLPLLRAIGAGRRPVDIQQGNFEVLLTSDAAPDATVSSLQAIH